MRLKMLGSEWFEQLDLGIDINALREEFYRLSAKFEPVMTSHFFGGWSVTSSNGSYLDGWMKANPMVDAKDKNMDELQETKKKLNFKGPQYYRQPTEFCGPVIRDVVKKLEENGYFPCRCRYTILKAKGSTPFHRDYPEWLYGVRLHIPIITNEHCFFEYESAKAHMPADGNAYLVKINRTHRVYNDSNLDRIHFLCDFFDLNQLTHFNKFTEIDRKNIGLV